MTDSRSDRDRWTRRYATGQTDERLPSPWIIDACARIPATSLIVDLAAGTGRNALALARQSRTVIAVDFVEEAVHRAALHPRVHGVVANVWALPFRNESLDAIVCTNFLERALFPQLAALLKPGGYLVYETYTAEHLRLVEEKRVRAPRSLAYLLQPGELIRLLAPLDILDAREGFVHDEAGERYCASAIARRNLA